MSAIKEFYGGTFLNTNGIECGNSGEKIELKYYKIINSIQTKNSRKIKFGVEVVKKRVENNVVTEEKKDIFNFIDNEDVVDKVLELLKVNKVSPINVMDVLEDMSNKRNKLYINKVW